MKKVVLWSFLLFIALPAYAQKQKILDSLNIAHNKAKHDTTKILVLSSIAAEYRISKPDTCITIAEKALEMSKKIQYQEGQRTSLYHLGLAHIRKGNYPMALEHFYQSMKLSEQMNDKEGIADCLQSIGNVYLNEKNYSSALEYYNRAMVIREELADRLGVSGLLNNIAIIYKDMADYSKSLAFSRQSLKLSKEMNNALYMSHTLRNIGDVKLNQGEYDSAIIFLNKSLNIYDYKKNNERRSLIFLLNSFAKVYQKKENYDKSIEYAQESLTLAEDIKLLIQVRNINEILYENYKMKGAYSSALMYHERFKKLNDSIFNTEKQASITKLEGKIALEHKEKEIALMSKENERKLREQKIYTIVALGCLGIMFLIAFLIWRNNTIQRKLNHQLSNQKQEIEIKSNHLRIANHQIRAKNEQLQTSEEELRQNMEELETSQEELRAQKEQLENAFKLLHLQNTKVNDSIRYAQRIQNAILPHQDTLANSFAEHFMIFKPKDVVSGDFYWYLEVGNKKFLAVVDCTGHGVPGAFMSMIGNTLLYEIINAKHIFEPHLILEELHSDILNSLNKKDSRMQDGMDIALCCIENQPNGQVKIQFSGAKRPLYYFSNQSLGELAADLKSIGQSYSKGKYTLQTLVLASEDTLYMTTDGWVDSINPARKRFGSQQFKEMLLKGANLPLYAQKEVFITILEDYEQGTEQRDDVLLVGVRV